MTSLTFDSPLGPITLTEDGGTITDLAFGSRKSARSRAPVLHRCAAEIREYLSGSRDRFTVPVTVKGTPFDHAVLAAMRKIGFGTTVSYAELAKRIGKPTACRAVANACGRNRLPILIPCHRVVASDGLGGFNAGIRRKKALLRLEGAPH